MARDLAMEVARDWDAAVTKGWAGVAAIAQAVVLGATASAQIADISSHTPLVSAVWTFPVLSAGRAWCASEVV